MVSLLIEVELIEFNNVLFKEGGVFFKVERIEGEDTLGAYLMSNRITNFMYIGKLIMNNKEVKVFESDDELIAGRKFIEVTYEL